MGQHKKRDPTRKGPSPNGRLAPGATPLHYGTGGQAAVSGSQTWTAPGNGAKMGRGCLLTALLAFVLYINTLPAEFAYDDSRAIVKNPDLMAETPLSQLFYDDFWGTPLTHSGSHKSYRPLCVLSFRLNYALGGLDPRGYHLTNVALHAAATALYTRAAGLLLGRPRPALLAGVLFAAHPVHTEAVAGVVGRADILACIAFLLAFLSYHRYCKYRDKEPPDPGVWDAPGVTAAAPGVVAAAPGVVAAAPGAGAAAGVDVRKWMAMGGTAVFTTAAMLSKEQGVTVLAVCLTYDLFVHSRLRVKDVFKVFQKCRRRVLEGALCLAAIGLSLIGFRIYFMGNKPPEFAPADNPASDSDSLLTRSLTYHYLPSLNLWLLLFPSMLSFDWSMGAVPLVESPWDPRNACTLTLYAVLGYITLRIVRRRPPPHVVRDARGTPGAPPGLPASSHPFPSSSSPSASSHRVILTKKPPKNGHKTPRLLHNGNGLAPGLHIDHDSLAGDTVVKDGSCNSASPVTGPPPPNNRATVAKRRGSSSFNECNGGCHDDVTGRRLGPDCPADQCLSRSGPHAAPSPAPAPAPAVPPALRTVEVLTMSLALLIFPFIPATNLFFYVGFVVAERVLYMPSMGFCLLVAHGAHTLHRRHARRSRRAAVSLQVALATLVLCYCARTCLRNQDWLTEENLYRAGISINPAKAWGNLANILNHQGKTLEAEEAYKAALKHRGNMADVHYNLGILLQEQKRYQEAIETYRMAIQCRPKLTMAHLNLGIVLTTLGQKQEAAQIYRHCADIDTAGLKDPRLHEQTKISALYNLGRLLADQDRYLEAVDVYKEAIASRPSHYAPQSLYNMLGEAYSKLERLDEAEHWYREALKAKTDHIPAHLTMGKLLHKKGLLQEAESWFQKAHQVAPDDSSVLQHYGQFLSESRRPQEAAERYLAAAALKPDDFELVFNTANALRQAGRNLEAETFYKTGVAIRPDEAAAHMNLGAMLHFNGNLDEAELSYQAALRLRPDDTITQANLKKLRNLMHKARKDGGAP